jgi:hypothetical protein
LHIRVLHADAPAPSADKHIDATARTIAQSLKSQQTSVPSASSDLSAASYGGEPSALADTFVEKTLNMNEVRSAKDNYVFWVIF